MPMPMPEPVTPSEEPVSPPDAPSDPIPDHPPSDPIPDPVSPPERPSSPPDAPASPTPSSAPVTPPTDPKPEPMNPPVSPPDTAPVHPGPPHCPYTVDAASADASRIDVGDFSRFRPAASPWILPFPLTAGTAPGQGRCRSWDASKADNWSFRKRITASVCDTIQVAETGVYRLHFSTAEIHRDVGILDGEFAHYRDLKATNPRALLRIFSDGGKIASGKWLGKFTRFYQWIDYRGKPVTTKTLKKGKPYKVCLTGLWDSFTLCTMDVVKCEKDDDAEDGFRCGRFPTGRERLHRRRYAERAASCS